MKRKTQVKKHIRRMKRYGPDRLVRVKQHGRKVKLRSKQLSPELREKAWRRNLDMEVQLRGEDLYGLSRRGARIKKGKRKMRSVAKRLTPAQIARDDQMQVMRDYMLSEKALERNPKNEDMQLINAQSRKFLKNAGLDYWEQLEQVR